jgi:hypothetical protein
VRAAWFDEIDAVTVVRGSSAGFTVLVLGGLLAPIVAVKIPVLGGFGLVVTAVAGFATAASRQWKGSRPAVQGILAAVGAYLLILPMVVFAHHGWDVGQVFGTLLTAVVVGAATAMLTRRIHPARTR